MAFDIHTFQLIPVIHGWVILCEIFFRFMSRDCTYSKWTLIHVIAWCRQATGYHLSQSWPRYTRYVFVEFIVWSVSSFFSLSYHELYHVRLLYTNSLKMSKSKKKLIFRRINVHILFFSHICSMQATKSWINVDGQQIKGTSANWQLVMPGPSQYKDCLSQV